MRSCGLFVITLFTLCCMALSIRHSQPFYIRRCNSLPEVVDTNNCQHGADINNMCSKMLCLKGLGEPCDNDNEILYHGKCATGLLCCDKCVGCRHGKCDPSMCQNKSLNRHNSNNYINSLPYYDYDANQ